MLAEDNPTEVQAATARALVQLSETLSLSPVFANWNRLSPATQRQLVAAFVKFKPAAGELVNAIEKGFVPPSVCDASARRALQQTADPELKKRVQKLFTEGAIKSREESVREFQAALTLGGDRRRGAEWFAKSCLSCHALQGQGGRVGPDLSGIASRPKEALLADILDPSRQLTPDFLNYTLRLKNGEVLNGLLAAESTASVTLRRVGEPDLTVLRRDIAHLQAESRSLMPEGLEQGLMPQSMADLLEFLAQPDLALLPQP
jgi:putative heme-binding domain-containing protein